jgi:hypothetical protein
MPNASIFQVRKNLHWTKYMCTKNTWQIWNLQTSVLAMWCFHIHLSSWTVHVEFSWDGALFSATPHYNSRTVYQNSLLQLHSIVFSSSLKDTMLLAYCGYWNGIKKDQWRIVKCPCSAHTPDNMESVRDATLQSLHTSAHWQALALHLKDNNHQILHKDLYYHPHKIQVAQELSEGHKAGWLQFSNEFLDLANNSSNTENTLLMSAKAHFHAWLCQQTCRQLAPNTPHELHHVRCIVRKWLLCAVFLWHYWSPFLSECGEMCSNCQCTAVQSHAANISIWVTSPAQFAMDPTGWNNRSHSTFLRKCSRQCLQADSFLVSGTSPGRSTHLILQYRIKAIVVMSEERHMSCQYQWLKTENSGM